MRNILFFIILVVIIACQPSKQIFKDELADEQTNDMRYRWYYRNDSLDFAFSYYALQKFNIEPTKQQMQASFLPKKWLKYSQINTKEVLFYTKERDWNSAFMGIAYNNKEPLVKLYEHSVNELKKSKEYKALTNSALTKSLKYFWTEKDSTFTVEEFYRTYKNINCKFIFFEKTDTKDSSDIFYRMNDDYFGHSAIMKTFEDSVKYKIYQYGKEISFSLMSRTFQNSNYNYLRPFFWADKFKKETHTKEMLAEGECMRTYYAYIGDYTKSITNVDEEYRDKLKNTKVDSIEMAQYKPQDAIEAILEKSKDRQLVILNEHHQNSYTRVFASKLLEGLYKQGFRYLSVETIYEDSLLNILKYPSQRTGVYTADPMFGNFIRQALKLGFKVSSHENYEVPCDQEDRIAQMNCRDYNQAINLQKIYKKDPDAKVFAYVGHGHLLKDVQKSGGFWLAGQFKKLTGIDALTIDQTTMREVLPSTDENPIYAYVEHKYKPRASIVLKKGDSYWVETKVRGDNDIQVFHPRSHFIDGHPEWMLKLGENKFPVHLEGKQYENTILQVFVPSERENLFKYPPTPLLNVPLKHKNDFDIYLPQGIYWVRVIDYLGNLLYSSSNKQKNEIK